MKTLITIKLVKCFCVQYRGGSRGQFWAKFAPSNKLVPLPGVRTPSRKYWICHWSSVWPASIWSGPLVVRVNNTIQYKLFAIRHVDGANRKQILAFCLILYQFLRPITNFTLEKEWTQHPADKPSQLPVAASPAYSVCFTTKAAQKAHSYRDWIW